MRRAQSGIGDGRKRPIFFEKKLTSVIKCDRALAVFAVNFFRALHNQAHRFRPSGGLKFIALSDERSLQSIFTLVGLPTVQSFGTKSPTVDAVNAASSHRNHASAAYTHIERTAVRAKDTGRLNPALWLGDGVLINALYPFPRVRSSLTPGINDPAVAPRHIYQSRRQRLADALCCRILASQPTRRCRCFAE